MRTEYKGLSFTEMDELEQLLAEAANGALENTLRESGFSEDTIARVSIEFAKATLTISAEEKTTGSYHNFADGHPFYRMQFNIAARTDNSFVTNGLDEAQILLLSLGSNYLPLTGNSTSVDHDLPGSVVQDFRHSIPKQVTYVIESVKGTASGLNLTPTNGKKPQP